MNLHLFILFVFAGFSLTSCQQTNSKSVKIQSPPHIGSYPKGYKVDSTDLYANITFDIKQVEYVFPVSFKATSLNNLEKRIVDSLIKVSVKHYNQESNKKGLEVIADLKNYRRQLVAAIDSNGVKQVYVNAFTGWSWFAFSWKKQLAYVNDGGAGYFHLYIDLKTKKVYRFNVNGSA